MQRQCVRRLYSRASDINISTAAEMYQVCVVCVVQMLLSARLVIVVYTTAAKTCCFHARPDRPTMTPLLVFVVNNKRRTLQCTVVVRPTLTPFISPIIRALLTCATGRPAVTAVQPSRARRPMPRRRQREFPKGEESARLASRQSVPEAWLRRSPSRCCSFIFNPPYCPRGGTAAWT